MIIKEDEINTIKPRIIELNLSDSDFTKIFKKAGTCNLTVGKLIENFIGDLVVGTYSNGSDEVMYAQDWFNRCWFSSAENNFLKKVINDFEDIDYIITEYEELEYYKKNPDEIDECLKKEFENHLYGLWEKFKLDSHNFEKVNLDDEMGKVINWFNGYKKILGEAI